MRQFTALILLVLAFSLIGCQTTETTQEDCTATLTDIMTDQMIMGISGVTVENVTDTPLPGSLNAEKITLNEESLMLGRYNSSETAVNLLTPASMAAAFGNDVTTNPDVPIIYGDETIGLQFNTDTVTESAIARYGNRLVMAITTNSDGVAEMLDAFDNAMLEYIEDNPACAALHPETR